MPYDLNNEIKKALITLAIEKALLNIGERAFEETGNRLYAKHQCYFADCLEHPEYLNGILKELFGDSRDSVIHSIRMNLEEFTHHKPIENFLKVISE